MRCSELQPYLSLYSDSEMDERTGLAVRSHLEVCPMCRQRIDDYRQVRSGLRRLPRPEIPASLQQNIRSLVRTQRRAKGMFISASPLRDLLVMRVMPVSVGILASITVAIAFLAMMFSTSESFTASDTSITPSEYARTRLGYGYESPSVNPHGALIALTKSLVRGEMKDDEVVVVADVFGNGLARIAEVVEPSRDREAVLELQRALQSDPDYAPFIPTDIEQRPESVRVVLKFQTVAVNTREALHQ